MRNLSSIHPQPALSLTATLCRAAKRGLPPLLAAWMTACKVIVTVPEGGRVVTEDGFVCLSGQTCVVEVSDDTFDSTFTAIPDEGYTFTHWAPKRDAFCGYHPGPCILSTLNFGENENLMQVLAEDYEYRLEPVFVGYDLEYWQQTVQEIDEGSFATNSFLYDLVPNVGGCDPGTLRPQVNTRAQQATNQVRAIHKLPVVDLDSFYFMQAQETSLVQRANNYLNHFPAPGDACYTASAEEGASTSNLGSGSVPSDPAADVFGWTNDNNNAAARMEAGHRRWMLFPELGYVAYGQVQGFTALKVFGFGMPPAHPVPASLEFVATPYKYYPFPLVSKQPPTPWSLSMVPPTGVDSAFNYFARAQVEVIEKETGKLMTIQNRHADNKRYGLANFLSWDVAGWEYDVEYMVKITDINLPGGGSRDLEYPVVVDRYHLFQVDYPLEATDSKADSSMQGNFNTANDRDSYQQRLKGGVSVTGSSEYSNWGFFVRIYDRGKRLVKSSDEPFQMHFPGGPYTVLISHCDEAGLCYQGTQTYSVTFTPLGG